MADPIESKTYTTGEVLDAPDMNNYQRDNWDYIRPRTIKASGKQAFTLISGGGTVPSAVSGSTSFGVTFTASPLVITTCRIGSNIDIAVNLNAEPSTTGFGWRVFTANRQSSSSDSGAFHWIAIGTVA